MKSLTQIRDIEAKGQKQIEAAQKDAQTIIADARSKESSIRAKVASEITPKEDILTEQTLTEAKKIIAATKQETTTQISLLHQMTKESQSEAISFILTSLSSK